MKGAADTRDDPVDTADDQGQELQDSDYESGDQHEADFSPEVSDDKSRPERVDTSSDQPDAIKQLLALNAIVTAILLAECG